MNLKDKKKWKGEPICVKNCSPSPFHTAGPPLSPCSHMYIAPIIIILTVCMRSICHFFREKRGRRSYIFPIHISLFLELFTPATHLTSVNLAFTETSTEHILGDLWSSVAEKENNVISMIWAASVLGPTGYHVCTSSVVLLAPRPPGEGKVKRCYCYLDWLILYCFVCFVPHFFYDNINIRTYGYCNTRHCEKEEKQIIPNYLQNICRKASLWKFAPANNLKQQSTLINGSK